MEMLARFNSSDLFSSLVSDEEANLVNLFVLHNPFQPELRFAGKDKSLS